MSAPPDLMQQILQQQNPAAPAAPGQPGPWKSGYVMPGQQPPQQDMQSVLEALAMTYGDQLGLSSIDKQLEQANALRGQAGPEGRDSGRIYTAANPLEHIGHGIGQYRTMKRIKRLEDEQKQKQGEIGGKVATYIKNKPGGY